MSSRSLYDLPITLVWGEHKNVFVFSIFFLGIKTTKLEILPHERRALVHSTLNNMIVDELVIQDKDIILPE